MTPESQGLLTAPRGTSASGWGPGFGAGGSRFRSTAYGLLPQPGSRSHGGDHGQYDAVAIAELPDDTALAKLALGLGAQGNIRTETLRAFTESEYRRIVAELP
jgi:GYD domain-containing protein